MKKVLLINGHPDRESFGAALANSYTAGASEKGVDIEQVNLIDLDFNPILLHGYRVPMPLEDDLVAVQDKIKQADHLVLVYPTWWGTAPALLKGFFDRILLPGFAFKYHKGRMLPEQLLKGKSARLIVTMNTPPLLYKLLYKNRGIKLVKDMTLGFCGIKPIKVTKIGPIRHSSDTRRAEWLEQVKELGRALK